MRAALLFSLALALVGCKKPPEAAAPKVGWIAQEGWAGACYYAPAWEALGPGDRKIARAKALTEIMGQWQGTRNDGVEFDDTLTTNVETALLSEPLEIEKVVARNTDYCEKAMTGAGTDGWQAYLTSVPGDLASDECTNPLVDQWSNYLDLQRAWQNPAPICKGDKVNVKGSAIDYYRLSKGGPWINAAGDPKQSATGTELPCNIEGCFRGQMVMRFTGKSGTTLVVPAGLGAQFTAPEDGKIEVMINDDSANDNEYKIESGMEHHTSIEYQPAK